MPVMSEEEFYRDPKNYFEDYDEVWERHKEGKRKDTDYNAIWERWWGDEQNLRNWEKKKYIERMRELVPSMSVKELHEIHKKGRAEAQRGLEALEKEFKKPERVQGDSASALQERWVGVDNHYVEADRKEYIDRIRKLDPSANVQEATKNYQEALKNGQLADLKKELNDLEMAFQGEIPNHHGANPQGTRLSFSSSPVVSPRQPVSSNSTGNQPKIQEDAFVQLALPAMSHTLGMDEEDVRAHFKEAQRHGTMSELINMLGDAQRAIEQENKNLGPRR